MSRIKEGETKRKKESERDGNEGGKNRERKRGVHPAGHIVVQQFCRVVALPRTGCVSSPSHSNLITSVSPLLILFSLY